MRVFLNRECEENKAGFSLIELMVVIAITSIVLVSIYGFFSNFTRAYTKDNSRRQLQQSLRSALNVMRLELRATGADPHALGRFGVVSAQPSSIEVMADQNVNGLLDESGSSSLEEHVSFFLDDGKLRRRTWSRKIKGGSVSYRPNTQSILEGVTALHFIYRDSSGRLTDDPSDIRIVEISISGSEAAGAGHEVENNYSTTIMLRNMSS